MSAQTPGYRVLAHLGSVLAGFGCLGLLWLFAVIGMSLDKIVKF